MMRYRDGFHRGGGDHERQRWCSGNTGADAAPAHLRRQRLRGLPRRGARPAADEQFNVTTTNFVPLTFKQIETAQPSLLIIDLIHGERAGWDLLAELRHEAATRDIPVILASTSKQLLEKAETERVIWGGDRYLLKPFSLDELLQAIQELVGAA
jgi:CheY-like chemotaxis protein